MAQVMVNFRIDEDVKRSMEQACKEMGLSMTAAFTIFATKVGKEKRIPFEITASPVGSNTHEGLPRGLEGSAPPERDAAALGQKREALEELCAGIRRSLTGIHTAIPAAIPGLAIERIRLLCSDELKDKTAAASNAVRTVLADRNAQTVREKDPGILEDYMEELSSVAEEVRRIERSLVPTLRAWSADAPVALESYEQRLIALSLRLDELQSALQRFAQSAAPTQGSAEGVLARLRRAAAAVSDPEVREALDSLEGLARRCYGDLSQQSRTHLESFYLQTLELVLKELGRAEQEGEDTAGKRGLCLRAISVLSQVVDSGSQAQRELSRRSLEAEVVALERLAALRGDIGN